MPTLQELVGTSITMQGGTSGALANGAAVQLATDFDNSAGLNYSATARLVAGFGAATGLEGSTVSFFLVPFTDATNPGSVDTTTPYFPPGSLKGTFVPGLNQTAAQYMDIEGIPLGPYKYRGYVQNGTGQNMTAGWTVAINGEKEQY